MVEFALVLPLIVLLLLLAIDFGRVFFGWVGLQNVARIGANYAALHPTADYGNSGDPDRQTYEAQIAADATGINCDLEDPLPEPSFPDGTAPGGRAVVAIECAFTLITPLIGSITGNPIELNAEATFPVRSGIIGSPGGGGGGGGGGLCRVMPDFADMYVGDAREAYAAANFLGTFSADMTDDGRVVDAQFETPETTPGACVDPFTDVFVTSVAPPVCTAPQAPLPKLIGLAVSDARAQWAATFPSGTFDPATGFDDKLVTNQITTPDLDPGECGDPDISVVVSYTDPPSKLCRVPSLVGVDTSQAQADWEAAEFTTAVQFGNKTPYTIGSQDVNADTASLCDSTVITVYRNKGGGGQP